MAKLIGTAPNQVPTNGDLGSMAFEDSTNYITKNNPAHQPYRNLIINGNMRIDQRNAGASLNPAGTGDVYSLDRWAMQRSVTGKYSVQQNAGSVTSPVGFSNYLGATSLSAYSLSAGDYFDIYQYIEGFNTADLGFGTANAKTITLSFWARSSLTGTFGGVISNNNYSRCYPYSYTISVANTWEYKTVTIAGDTGGTWLTTNGRGMQVSFGLGVGTTYSGTAGSWSSTQYLGTTGATSVVGTSGATFYITGVQLEVGTEATPFEHRPYDMELQRCQRYFQQLGNDTSYGSWHAWCTGVAYSTTDCWHSYNFPTTMRASPSVNSDISLGNFQVLSNGNKGYSSLNSFSFNNKGGRFKGVGTGFVSGYAVVVQAFDSNGNYIKFDAEL